MKHGTDMRALGEWSPYFELCGLHCYVRGPDDELQGITTSRHYDRVYIECVGVEVHTVTLTHS